MVELNASTLSKPMPVWTLLRGAALQAWQRHTYFLKLISLPIIFTGSADYLEDQWFDPNTEQPIVPLLTEITVSALAYGVFIGLFAVVIHRSILLDERISPADGSSGWAEEKSPS